MPSNATGWFWHSLARETGALGHLYSPNGARGPWPWFPFALDNGVFSLWDPKSNNFDEERWITSGVSAWRNLIFWAQASAQKPLWAIVPDRPGDAEKTLHKWDLYAHEVMDAGIPLAIAVQDGMVPQDVHKLSKRPEVIAIGGTTEWKWSTVERWVNEFPRVHVLRCNSPEKLEYLHKLGVESTDGTGWNRGNRSQTSGLEEFCRRVSFSDYSYMRTSNYVCRTIKDKNQLSFA